MERQGSQRTARHHEKVPLVFDERLDPPQQRIIEFVGGAEIEQLAFDVALGERSFIQQHSRIEAATKPRDAIGESRMPEIDLVPSGAIMSQGENIAFPVPDRECHQRLVAGQQTLDVARGQGLRVGQRRTLGSQSQSSPGSRLGRAEALRRTMLAFLADPSLPPYYAYPAIWGPFSLVGEGAVGAVH